MVLKLQFLSRLLERNEKWAALKDFDRVMKSADARIASADSAPESVQAATLLHQLARDHFYLLLVGEYKIKEIGRGVLAALDARNETVLFNLARAFMEHTAALAYQIAALDKAIVQIPKKPDLKCLSETVSRHRTAVSGLYYNKRADIHINDMIRVLTKDYESAGRDYDDLCEFVHPNYGSNKLVSSGKLGAGHIGSHEGELATEVSLVIKIIERCSELVDDFGISASFGLIKIDSWMEIACQKGSRLSQVFSLRNATSGDGRSKETAIFFSKARTHAEATAGFYNYLDTQKIVMHGRQIAAVEDGFIFDVVSTNKGALWFKFRMPEVGG
jgi:hypothetical protein